MIGQWAWIPNLAAFGAVQLVEGPQVVVRLNCQCGQCRAWVPARAVYPIAPASPELALRCHARGGHA